VPEAVTPPLLYLREVGDRLELVRSEGNRFTADPITPKQAAAMQRDLAAWLYRRIQE
jgi:hypothetical protein